MQRFFTLVALLLFALPLGLSTTGCVTNVSAYCNNAGYGIKKTDIYKVTIPVAQADTGISLAYGQFTQIPAPTVTSCTGSMLTTGAPTYGSGNLQFADVSPTGSLCAGTWNRLSPGSIPDFTICTPPSGPMVTTVTASVGGVTSNPVQVFIHPPVSSISINLPPAQQTCYSYNTPGPTFASYTSVFGLDGVPITTGLNGTQNNVGTITYTAQTPAIVTIDNTPVLAQNGIAFQNSGTTTANQPGGTVIIATLSGTSLNSVGTSSAAGYFYTCPPKSIALSIPPSTGQPANNGAVTITEGNPQTITSVITDSKGVPISPASGSGPDFTSTFPQQVAVTSAGLVSTAFPGTATITGICQPGSSSSSSTTTATAANTSNATGLSCNPTPLNQLGVFGTGLPIVSNPLTVNATGINSALLWAASPQSQRFTPFDLSLGTAGTPVLLPYPPNSMVLDPTGSSLYFGSYRELMIYSAATNTNTVQDTTVPGVVLAVSPSNNQVVIADQSRQVIYLYTPSAPSTTASGQTGTTSASVISTGGLATHAVYAPDGKNVYITGPDTLYVHNIATGWSSYPLTSANPTTSCALKNSGTTPFCSPDVAVTIPSVAVFLSGNPVTARSFCPDVTTNPVTYNPLAATVAGNNADHLASTFDGAHVIGANTTQVFDIEHAPTTDASRLIAPIGPCPGISTPAGPLAIDTTLQQLALTGITPTQIDQVLSSPDSSKAFITYTATNGSGLLPVYTPSTIAGTIGTLSNVQLAAGALAPLAGVFTQDSANFFVSTTGDNMIHEVNAKTLTDALRLNPELTNSAGQPVPAQFLATKPRPTT